MNNINEEMSNLQRLVEMLAAQFGKNSEIVLHDLKKDYEHTIVAIENNEITKRKVGDGGTNLGLEVLRNPPNAKGDIYNYVTKTPDGRFLRSSTLYFRDERGMVIGSLCINTDITKMLDVQEMMQEFTAITNQDQVEEVFANNVGDLFDFFLRESKKLVDKPAAQMTKEEKMKIVKFLDSKGFFLITHAGDSACEYLDISKYTLYKYLGIAREETAEHETENGASCLNSNLQGELMDRNIIN